MSAIGNYLYGFTDARFRPEGNLRGVADAPVRLVGFRDVAAVVSDHPVQRLAPRRANLEPHHRIVRLLSSRSPLVPAAFGHISQNEKELVEVLRENYEDIRQEIERLANKAEMGLQLRWTVANIFEYFVRTHPELREVRDRVFRMPHPSLEDKLQVGALFETLLTRERERLSSALLDALRPAVCDTIAHPARDEKIVSDSALLIDCAHGADFAQALKRAALLFDSNYTLQYSGPWPPYSFVRLHLHTATQTPVM